MTRSLSTVMQCVEGTLFTVVSFPRCDSSIDQMLRMFIPVLLWLGLRDSLPNVMAKNTESWNRITNLEC